jgi:hypothetical protein
MGNYNSVRAPVVYATAANTSQVVWICVPLDKAFYDYSYYKSPVLCGRAWRANGKLYGEAGVTFDSSYPGNVTLFKANAASTNKLVATPINPDNPTTISSMSVNPTGAKQVVIDKSNPYGAFFEMKGFDYANDTVEQRGFVYANDIVYYFEPGNPGYVTVGFTGNGARTG